MNRKREIRAPKYRGTEKIEKNRKNFFKTPCNSGKNVV